MHARLAWPGCGRPSTPAWRRPASGQPWPLASRPSSSSWPPSRSRCWCPATARRAARARRPTRRRAIRRNGGNAGRDAGGPRRGRARPRCLQHPRRPLTRPRRLRPRRLRLRIPPRLRRSPPRLRPVPRRAAHPDTQGITAAEPGESRAATDHARTPRSALHRRQAPKAKQPHRTADLARGPRPAIVTQRHTCSRAWATLSPSAGGWLAGWPVVLGPPDLPLMRVRRGGLHRPHVAWATLVVPGSRCRTGTWHCLLPGDAWASATARRIRGGSGPVRPPWADLVGETAG